jgi:S-(hydroxymethyl)glutathione dehydrogenase/alcohol dehydrogenase
VVRAAVLPAVNAPLVVTDIDLPDPGPGQVRVRLAAAGVCHSDLSLSNGTLRQPAPAVLGHEGAGTVVAVGEGVDHVAAGDPVVLNWAPACGTCHFCGLGEPWLCSDANTAASAPYATLTADGSPLYPGLGTAVFAEETVVAARAVLPLPAGVPLTDAALLGCAVLTGYGAVHHAAAVREGESVAVYGVGGVGLAVLQAARIAGAGPIVAVDVAPGKEELARAAGATDFVVAGDDTAKRVRALTGGHGADVAIECVGRADTIRTAGPAPAAAAVRRSSASAARTRRSPSARWSCSTSAAPCRDACTATATRPRTCPCWPHTYGRAVSTCPAWSPTGSAWTASPPRSRR